MVVYPQATWYRGVTSEDAVDEILIPTEEVVEVKDGKKTRSTRKFFPGYVLVNMILTEESWFVVRNTPGVTGFVGMGNNPTPLRPEEVSQIVKRMEAEAPTVKVTFKVAERSICTPLYASLQSILSFNFIFLAVFVVTQFIFDQVSAYQTSNLVINE